ncbi:ATP-binding cassette sub-family B member 9 [Strongyloides ratti]|uniref:Arginyl-tRNA synthetase n=1 Tax=Strongyloides ratti TaxID=34506 RepID=A0A090LK77_STRRB|nr:ATP-binding cassette sub-family B member 9 [Strongyloides ratti]CEF68553.1 ATP-binding cassette sub-family B member 9 [Strongyloides ratti]
MYRILNKIIQTPNLVSSILSKEVVKKSKYVIDYSSPNVAKMFHIGNLRSTLLGDFIKNIYLSANHDVIGINYLGDWGTQFGILLLPFIENKELLKEFDSLNTTDKMRYMTSLYIDYNKKCEENIELKEKAKKIFNNLENYYRKENSNCDVDLSYELEIINLLKLSSFNYLQDFYSKFNISFDTWLTESDTIKDAFKIVEKLKKENKTQITKNGLTILKYSNSDTYATLAKSDGSSLYLTRDVASIINRDQLYSADKYIYITDRAQISHFESLKVVLENLDRDDLSKKILHIPYGRVKGLSTRHGRTNFVDDILENGILLSKKYIETSPTSRINSDSKLEETSETLAISTIKINEYQRKKTTEYEFSFNDAFKIKRKNALMFQSRYSRLCSLIKNNNDLLSMINNSSFKFDLNIPQEYKNDIEKLIFHIDKIDKVLLNAHNTLEPVIIIVYLSELCSILGPIIQNIRISEQGNDIGASRLLLFLSSKHIIESLLRLLGVTPIEEIHECSLLIYGYIFYVRNILLNYGIFIYSLNFISFSYSLIKFEAFADNSVKLHFTLGSYLNVIWNVFAWFIVTSIWVLFLHRRKLPFFIEKVVSRIEKVFTRNDSSDNQRLLENPEIIDGTNDDEKIERISTFETAWRLLKYCHKFKFWFSLGFIFLIIYSVARIFIPYCTGTLIAGIVNKKGTEAVVKAIILTGILSVIASIFGGMRGGCFDWSTALIQKQVRDDLFRSLVQQEIAFFDEAQTGEVASRLTSDCEVMSSVISTNFNVFLRSIVMMIGSFIFMFTMSWRLSLVTFILIPLVGFITNVYGSYYDKLAEECQNTIAEGNKKAEEVLSTMRTVRSFASETTECNSFEVHLFNTLTILKKRSWAYFGYTVITEMCENVILIGILTFGGYLCLTDNMTTDDLIKFLLYQMQLGENFYNLGWVFTNLMQAVGSSRKVFDYILRKPKINNDGSLKPIVNGDIKIKNVYFSYPSRPNQMILQDFSLHIKSGETVALVGSSGNGKTTIVSLLQRFYLPQDGEILLDDININTISHQYYHSKIALVAQEPILYSGTIRENILYGYDNGTEEEMIEAAKLANCHDFIIEMNDGYNTTCGEKGIKMSGGQKQRIAIARALVRKPAVLILDEATSALDAESEHKIQEALDKCSKNITIIKVAHRLNSVENADRICVVDKGVIIQEGNHQKLMENKDGMYYNLVQKQLLSQSTKDSKMEEDIKLPSQTASKSSSISFRFTNFVMNRYISIKKIVILTILFSFVDISVNVIGLSWHGTNFNTKNILKNFTEPFNFLTSIVDVAILGVVRIVILTIGVILLAYFNDIQNQMDKLRHALFCIVILLCSYSPTKVLFLAEKNEIFFVGDYICIVGNFVNSVVCYIIWKKYFCCNFNAPEIDYDDYDTLSDNSFIEEGEDKQTLQIVYRLLQFVKREWIWHVSGFFWLFIYSLTRIFVPYYTGNVIAALVPGQGYTALIEAIKLMSALAIGSSIAAGFRGGSFEYGGARVARIIRNDLFTSLVHQEVAFYDVHKTGEIISRLAADTQTMADTVPLNLNVFLRNTVMCIGSMLFMMGLSWKLSLITFIVVPIIFVVTKIFGSYYDELSELTQDAIASSNDTAEEVISTMRTVRSFACEEFESQRYFDKLTDTLNVTWKKAISYLIFIWASEIFQTVIVVAVLWYGGHLVLTNRLKGDLLVSFLLYQVQLADNLRQIGEVLAALLQSVGASRKVFQYIERKPNIEMNGKYKPEKIEGRIEFKNVRFNYPSRPDLPILHDISFVVEPGETVALVGPSGSGKSSCIGLIERFYEPLNGKILIDNIPIEEYEHHYIHRKIALVGQEPVLFHNSISENISYGLDYCPEADIIESAKKANAHNFIVQTRDHYKTNVGERGGNMSGGQKQRIAIARALVRSPTILLLDEATSALDTESEALVQEALAKNMKQRSVLLIAHRLSTVETADKIIVIDKGRIAEIGNHQELMAKEDGIYRQLVQRQMIGQSPESSVKRNKKVSRAEDSNIHNYLLRDSSIPVGSRGMANSLLATSFSNSSVYSK